MKYNKIYTICVIQVNSDGTHDRRTVGFSFYKNQAIEWVERNDGDMHEESYQYAVVEEFAPGVYYLATYQQWFKWVDGKYVPTDKPNDYACISNFAMG